MVVPTMNCDVDQVATPLALPTGHAIPTLMREVNSEVSCGQGRHAEGNSEVSCGQGREQDAMTKP